MKLPLAQAVIADVNLAEWIEFLSRRIEERTRDGWWIIRSHKIDRL